MLACGPAGGARLQADLVSVPHASSAPRPLGAVSLPGPLYPGSQAALLEGLRLSGPGLPPDALATLEVEGGLDDGFLVVWCWQVAWLWSYAGGAAGPGCRWMRW